MSKEVLKIAKKRKEVKGKGERERYNQLNAEFQRTAKRNKKAVISEQCKEIEENKCKKANWLSGEALQIAEKRREMEGKE